MTTPALGCQTARSRTLEVNGLRLHALESGLPGHSPVCLLHYHHLMLDRPAAFTAALDVFLRRIGGAGG